MPNFSGQNFIYNEDVDSYVINDSGVITDIFDGIQININPSTEISAELSDQFWFESNTDNPQIFIQPWPGVNHRESKIVPWDFDIYFLDDSSYTQSGLIGIARPEIGLYDAQDQEITSIVIGNQDVFSRSYPFYIYNNTLNDTMSLIGIDDNRDGFNPWEDKILVGTSDENGLWVGTTCEIDFSGVLEESLPSADDVYSVKFNRPFWSGDYLFFDTGDFGSISDSKLSNEMDKIKVVPNPYVMTNLLEESIYNTDFNQRRKLMFTHLPAQCIIEIYLSLIHI